MPSKLYVHVTQNAGATFLHSMFQQTFFSDYCWEFFVPREDRPLSFVSAELQ